MSRLVLRADADPDRGAGHAMRLATLGAAWRRAGGEVVFAGRVSLPFVEAQLERLAIPLVSRGELEGDVLVVDSYDDAVRLAARVVTGVRARVLVDDLGEVDPGGYDAIWNPNPFGHADLYPGFRGRVVTGPAAVPVRPDLPARGEPIPNSVLVTLGGGRPPAGVRAAIRKLARRLPDLDFAMAGEWSPPDWRRIERSSLWEVAARSERVVLAAGTSTWEAAAMGLPLVLVKIADNQRLVFRWARDAGVPGVDASMVDPDYLAEHLEELLPVARPLPTIRSGADHVARSLLALRTESR